VVVHEAETKPELREPTGAKGAGQRCKTCARPIVRKRALAGRLFCNYKCYGKWLSCNNVGDKNPSWKSPPVKLRCARCSVPFEVRPASFRLHGRKYCSMACSSAASLGRPRPQSRKGSNLNCVTCGAIFYAQPNEQRRGKKYCSVRCNPTTIKPGQFAKDKHPMWRGDARRADLRERESLEYKQWRMAVIERDRFICQDCGRKGGNLSVHHIKPFSKHISDRFSMLNGITLCWPCHLVINRREEEHAERLQRKITTLF
jgi:5-methylcytosine-specific restriction endonuclease McrA